MTQTTRPILVTGANKGIGRATVEALVDQADDIRVFLGSRSSDRGRRTRAEIARSHPEKAQRIEVVQLDITDEQSIRRARQDVADTLGSDLLYGLVNNAGIGDHGRSIETVLDVNVYGPHRVCEAFVGLLDDHEGRVVNISSASGPNFVAECSPRRQALLCDPRVAWDDIVAFMNQCIGAAEDRAGFGQSGIGNESAYGLSKACLNAYTIALARQHPDLLVNACTPGFIETDLTRPMAERRGQTPAEAGMHPPREGTTAQIFLLFGQPAGSGWYFGSDAQRSPLDRYRSPGDPSYAGD